MCVHWMTWCLPWILYSNASRDLLGGTTSHIVAPLRNDILEVVMTHCREVKRKARNKAFLDWGE